MVIDEQGDLINSVVERINPYLSVRDISAGIKFYCEIIGFDLYIETPNLGIIEWNGHQIHLTTRSELLGPHQVWIGVDNIENLFDRYKKNGVKFIEEPRNYSWAYQMIVEDPDGNRLIFGSAPKEGKPYLDIFKN